MQHMFASRHGFRPARIALKIDGKEGEALASLGGTLAQHGTQSRFAAGVAQGRAYLMSRGEQLQNAVTGDKSRSTGDQNHTHSFPPNA
jgi:hypothetical protein